MQHRTIRVLVLNGPNLGALGSRQPDVYGSVGLDEVMADLTSFGVRIGVDVTHLQTDDEAELITQVQDADADGIVLNPGAFTHTSHALGDAVRSVGIPVVEVHVSDVKGREPWRAVSTVEDACVATVYGRGPGGYRDAVRILANRAVMPFDTVRYGPHPDNVGDLRQVGGKGLVVLLHGGVWRHQYRRDTIESLAVDLARRGFDTWNIEYRLFGTGGGWPGSGHDVLTALEHARRILEAPIALVGHSAGGYLGMWAGARASAPVTIMVALAPVVDLEMAVSDRGELAHEARLLLEAGAPSLVDPAETPTLVVHGEQDSIVPVSHAAALEGRPGVSVERVAAGHFDLLDPTKPHWEAVVERITGSLGRA